MGLLMAAGIVLGLGLLSRWAQRRDPRWRGCRIVGEPKFRLRDGDAAIEGQRAFSFALGQVALLLSIPLVAIALLAL